MEEQRQNPQETQHAGKHRWFQLDQAQEKQDQAESKEEHQDLEATPQAEKHHGLQSDQAEEKEQKLQLDQALAET